MADVACEVCGMYARGESAKAEALEAIQEQRLVLTVLKGVEVDVDVIGAELTNCHPCTGRLAVRSLGMTAQSLVLAMNGDRTAAIRAIEGTLAEDLYSQ